MRIGVLTTDTPHHRYFVRQLQHGLPAAMSVSFVMLEMKPYPWSSRAKRFFLQQMPNPWTALLHNPYLQSKRLAREILTYERIRFFPTGEDAWPAEIPVVSVFDVNDAQAAAFLDQHPCDILFVYGTGLVKPSVYERAGVAAINAHGGRLPHYRGLDTNLWAALQGDPQDMAVTLHQIAAKLDTGDIFVEEQVAPVRDLSLVSLRYHTTLAVCAMTLGLMPRFLDGTVTAKPQTGESRYYGPMPHLLKLQADRRIRRWIETTSRLGGLQESTS